MIYVIGGLIVISSGLFIASLIIRRRTQKEAEQYVNNWNEAYLTYDKMLKQINSIDKILKNQKEEETNDSI